MTKYKPFRDAVAAREETFREQAPNVLNVSSLLQPDQGTPSSPPSAINPNEIPSVGALANMKAVSGTESTARQEQNKTAVQALPKYVDAYRNYLKWRYPTRYGRKGGGGGGGGGSLTSYNVPGLGDPFTPPKPTGR
jgi:hypothetical protein